MSTNHYSWTFLVDADAPVPAPDAVRPLIQSVSAGCLGVDIESRGDWCAWTLARMGRRAGSTALDFLEGGTGETRVVDEDDQPWGVTLLRGGAIDSARSLVEALRRRAREDAAWFIPFFNDSRWDDAEILELIARPRFGRGDEGVGPGYCMATLAGLDDLMKDAQAQGKAVAHVRLLVE
jgi:hypothetical protein